MSSDPSNDNKNLPPWLRDVPLPPRPRERTTPSAAAGDQAGQLPAWLGETSTPAPASADLPDWLRGEQSARPAGTGDHGELPDWLRSTQANQPSSAGDAEQLPSWLHDMSGTPPPDQPAASSPPASATGEAALPDWLRESQAGTPSTPPEQLPDWLLDIAGLPADQGTPEPAGSQEPGQASPSESEHVPTWLRDQEPAAPPEAPAPAAQPPASSASDSAAPNWLGDIGGNADEISGDVEPFTFDDTSGTGQDTSAPTLPAWLSNADDTQDSGVAMPDWLHDTGSATSPQPDTPAEPPDWLTSASEPASAKGDTIPGQPDVPLWLQDIDQQSAASEPIAEPPAASNQPSWLQDTPAAQPDAESIPSWLQDTTTTQPDAPEPAAPQPDAGSLPSWLQEMPAERAEPPAAETLPSWLQDTSSEQPASKQAPSNLPSWLQETPTAQPPTGADMPPWLSDASNEQLAVEPEPAEPSATDQPAWLQETPATQPAEATSDTMPVRPAPEAPEQDDLPEWLRPAAPQPPSGPAAQDIPPWLRDEAGQPLPTAGTPGDTNLPAWLRGATIDSAPSTAPSPPPAAPTPQSAPASFDWFADEAAPALPEPAASAANNELVGGIELPAWLRPPEPEQPKELNTTDARSLDWLTRLGGPEEEESVGTAVAPATKLRPPSAPARTAAQIEAIALLQRLAAQPYPEVAPIAEAEAPSIWRRFGLERLLYLALLAALVIALALPISGSLGLNVPPTAPGAQDMFAQIDQLTPNDTVLVGYEWDARRSGELRPLEQAVLGHLIQRQVKLVLVSTDAQGTLLLFDLRDELGAAGYKPSGEDYILLGYKPGAELALRSLAQDFRGALRSDFQGNDATMSGLATDASGQPRLNSLANFAMVLVLADEPADVQGWMEQVRTSARKSDGSYVPFGFVLPAETAPIVQPYLSQANIFHLSGKQGALAYQQLRGQNAGADQIAGEAGQQRLSLLIYIILFLLGAAGVGISSAVARGGRRP